MLDRKIFKVEVHEEPVSPAYIEELQENIANALDIEKSETRYLISLNTIQKDMYSIDDDSIDILYKDGTTKDISEASEILNVALLSKKIRKYYLCYQRI
jgi:hypothetical protein